MFWYLARSPLPGMLLCYIDISSHVALQSIGPVWRVPWCELFFNYNIRMVTQYMICGWASIAINKVQRDVYPLVYHCTRIHCTHTIKYDAIDFLLVLQVVKKPFKCIIYITYTCQYIYIKWECSMIFSRYLCSRSALQRAKSSNWHQYQSILFTYSFLYASFSISVSFILNPVNKRWVHGAQLWK